MTFRVGTTVTCALVLAVAWASFDGAVQAKDQKDKKKRRGGPAAASSATRGDKIAVEGVREPSGIAFHPGLRHLFVVGDEGTLAELDEDGRTLRVDPVPGNLEDLVFHPQSGLLVLLVEDPPGLVVYDPATHQEKRRIGLDVAALLLSRAPQGGKGQGFEGLAFRTEPGRAGGGVFYLAHQRSPARVVAVAIDPAHAATVDNASVVTRWPLDRYQRLTAISYEASLGRFLLIADGRLAVLDADGNVESEHALPAVQPEGVCLDGSGALWIADDPAGLLRFAGGVPALARISGGGSPGTP